ncbi:MAG: phage tail tape measure protein [Sphingobium sp.]
MSDRNLRLRITLEALDRLTKPLQSISGASARARKGLADTQKELKAVGAAQQQLGKFKGLEGNWQATRRDLTATEERLAGLRRQLEATEAPSKKLRTEFAQAERQSAALRTRLDQQGNELQQLSAKLTAAGVDTKDLAAHEDRLAHRAYAANQRLKQQEAALEKLSRAKRNSDRLKDISGKAAVAGASMTGAGVAMATPVVMGVKQAMTLESAMADVSKVTNMTDAQIARLSNDFLDLSENIPMASNELAQIAAAAGAAGIGMDKFGKPMADQRQQLLEFTNDAAEMGVAFDMTAETAGETMAKWRTAFELPQAGVRALGDSVNALTNTFGGKAANVSDIVTRIGPLGKVAGLAAPEIAALGSTLDSIGIPSEVAATGIKNTMLALTKGEAATKTQIAAFTALGLSATDVAKRMQTDAAGAIVDVMTRIGKLDADKQSGLLTRLFGSESVAAIAPMLTNLDGLQQRLALVGNVSKTAGSMHGEFLNRIATTEGATGLATNALSNLNIKLGQALLPTVVAVAEKVKGLASGMRGWAQEHPLLAKGIMLFLAGGAALLVLLGGLGLAFAALTAAAAPLGIALGPLLLIVAAVAAIAAAAFLIYANWGAITAWFAGLWETVKGIFSSALNVMIQGFLNFTPLGLIVKAMLPALAYLRSLNLMEIGRNLIQGLIRGISSMLSALKATIVDAASAASNWFKQKLGIRSPSRVFAQFGGFMMDGLQGGIAANQAAPIEQVKRLADHIAQAGATTRTAPATPIGQRVTAMASKLATAAAIGAALPAFAASPAPPLERMGSNAADIVKAVARGSASAPVQPASPTGGGPAGAPAPPGGDTYHIALHAAPGMSEERLMELLEQKLRDIERRKEAARRSSFSDDQDYGGLA